MTASERRKKSFRVCLLAALAVVGGWLYLAYFTPTTRAVRARLDDADTQSRAAVAVRLKPLDDLLARGRRGAKAFAEEAVSWNGKWQFVKGLVDGGSHDRYLADAFGRHVFTPRELQQAMEGCVAAYLSDLDAVEGEMLVRLRADLADPARPATAPTGVGADEAYRREFRALAAALAVELRVDIGVTVGREVGVFVASDMAARAAVQAARAAAVELGVSGGILGTGAASAVATIGVGVIVAIIIDYLIDSAFGLMGYDPVAEVAAKVAESLDRLREALLRDPSWYSSETAGALRQRLDDLHESRSKVRREAVKRLLNRGGLE